MRHPVFTIELLEKGRHSLLTTGRWTHASESWVDKLHSSISHAVIWRFHMVGIVYGDL